MEDEKAKQMALLDGEEIAWKIEEVSANGHQGSFGGKIFLTNYRLIYLNPTGALVVCSFKSLY